MEFQPVAITTTSDDKTVLQSIANRLINQKLAACVQISGPIESWYRWQGNVENSSEFQCTIKTRATHIERIKDEINQLHNYEEPQFVAFSIVDGSESYLNWLEDNTDF